MFELTDADCNFQMCFAVKMPLFVFQGLKIVTAGLHRVLPHVKHTFIKSLQMEKKGTVFYLRCSVNELTDKNCGFLVLFLWTRNGHRYRMLCTRQGMLTPPDT